MLAMQKIIDFPSKIVPSLHQRQCKLHPMDLHGSLLTNTNAQVSVIQSNLLFHPCKGKLECFEIYAQANIFTN